jgi:DNA-binding transcriptional LysR family regulator
MELRQIKAFLEVANKKSFVEAAKVIHVTQPSLSARIRGLEQELGTELFYRLSKGVTLTDVGKTFLPYAEKVVDTLRQADIAIRDSTHSYIGRLHLGAARVISTYVLPDILKVFREKYTGVDLAIKTGRSSQVLRMLLDDEVDIAITRSLHHPQLESFHIYDEQIVLVTYPDHPFASLRAVSVEDVGHEPLILYDKDSTYYRLISSVCSLAGIDPNIVMDLDSIEATKKMVIDKLGVSFLPMSSLKMEIDMGLLITVPLKDGLKVTLPTSILYRKGRATSGVVKAFLGVIKQLYKTKLVN